MTAFRSLKLALALPAALALVACEPSDPSAFEDFSEELGAKTDSATSNVKIVGSLAYGETSPIIAYKNPPKYRAFKFAGDKGDVVQVDVRAAGKGLKGDAQVWVLDDALNTLAFNDNASAKTKDARVELTLPGNANPDIVTYYIVFRDAKLQSRSFQVSLAGQVSFDSCQVDADCTKILGGCCKLGWTAITKGKEDAYFASLDCPEDLVCPLFVPNDIDDVAQCNNDTNRCELVDPLAIACQGFSINPHFCPEGYTCIGDGLSFDVPGTCREACDVDGGCAEGSTCVEGFCQPKTCGGLTQVQCPGETECIEDPNDSCDVNNGGADCGGICAQR